MHSDSSRFAPLTPSSPCILRTILPAGEKGVEAAWQVSPSPQRGEGARRTDEGAAANRNFGHLKNRWAAA